MYPPDKVGALRTSFVRFPADRNQAGPEAQLRNLDDALDSVDGSAWTEPGPAVNQLPGDVEMTGMSRGLFDHVQDHPAHVRGFVAAVPAAWRR